MDILKFAQEGNVKPNPDYNSKTKKGATPPPTITDYAPGTSTSDEGRSVLGRTLARGIYNLSKYDVDKYTPYKTYVNTYDTEEELNKERAKNQGVLEQTGRFLGQAVGSEIVLGSLRGFSDLADGAARLVGLADNDYTNPISEQLASMQEAVRERFEIYRQNPDENFDFGDTGWWLGNAVSIASTLSLFIPGTAISKLGKLMGMGRLARGVGRVAGKVVGKPNVWGKMAESGADILGTAAASRVAENYIEARDTYTQVYDEAKNRLAQMSPKEKEELYKYNPKLKGLDDEAIAKYISGESADDTFTNDMWLMLLDAMQLKGLKNIWKGARNAATTRGLREANEQAAARLVGREIARPTGIKKYLRLPDKGTVKDIILEGSEGFEEGWQYAQQQIGVDNARKILNDEYQTRTTKDYLKDPQMWEQAFWGWLGGVTFQGAGSFFGKQYNKYIAKNKDLLTEAREAEIAGRSALLDNYVNNMNILNNNLNPNAPIIDDNGQQVTNSDGSVAYEELNDTEKDALKQTETEKLITDLTINAVDKGNYELLKDFLNTEDVAQYIDKAGVVEQGTSKQFLANINAKMNEVHELYEGELNKAINNDAKDAAIAMHIAKENTYNKLAARSEQRIADGYTTDYNASLNNITNDDIKAEVEQLNNAIKLDGIKAEIDYLNNQLKTNDDNLKAKKINKLEHSHIARKINNKKQAFIKSANATDETSFNALYNENRNNEATRKLAGIDKNLVTAVYGRSMAERRKTLVTGDIAETNEQIRDRANYVENQFKIAKDEAFKDTLKQLDNAFDSNNIDSVLEYLSGNKDVELSDNVKSELDIIGKQLNLLDSSSEPFVDVISRHARIKARQKGERPVATVNNEPVDVPPVVAQTEEEAPTESENTNEEDNPPSNPPTGGQEQSPPEVVVPKTEDSVDDKVASILAEQDAIQERQFNAGAEINNYILDNFLRNPNEEITGLSYDEQYAYIKNEFINQGYTAEIIDSVLPKELSSIRTLLEGIAELQNEEHASSIDMIVAKLMSADETSRVDYFKNLIDLYKASNNILTIDGRDYFNIISLMRFVINESNATFETVNKLYTELATYLQSEANTNLININPKDINLSRETLMELVQDQEKEDPELDNNVGVGKLDAEGRMAVSNLVAGQKLDVLIKPQGVEFYVTTVQADGNPRYVKVGFNIKGKRTTDNDGYIFDNGFITYEIRYDENGYSSGLDEVFDKLNPENGVISDEAKQFIDYLYKNKANTLTEEDKKSFWNNAIAKELLNNLKNKNTNEDNAIRLLDTIGAIYLYKVSDNLDTNYQSYIDWIAKQYNNYKMVDTIMNNEANINVTVKYVSKGQVAFSEDIIPENIDKAIVGFNYQDIHLGVISADGEIHDAINGSVRVKAGFRRGNMVAIVPNGTNEPFYAKIIPQGFDKTNPLGQAIRQEILDSIKAKQEGNISFEELRNRLMSIFGVKNFIDGINCIEYDNRIIIAPSGSKIPLLTIYKFKNNSTETGTGMTLNPTQVEGAGIGRTGWGGTVETELTTIIDRLLDSSVYSMSHGIAQNNSNNPYVNNTNNGVINIKIGGKEFTYDNYLKYIIDNGAGKIKLGSLTVNNTRTNFNPTPREEAAKQKLRIEYEVLRPVEGAETARNKAITAIEQQGNQTNIPTTNIIKATSPDFNTSADEAIISEILPNEVNIDTNDAETRYAAYNSKTDTVTLFKPFFDLARSSQYKAVRTLAHEQLHRRIYAEGIMNSQKFLDEITTIRNRFIEALNNPEAYPLFDKHISDNLYDKDKYIEQLRKVVDPANYEGKSYNYMLEEFIVESLTNDVLNTALNNIESTKEVSAETKRPNLWQRVINLIRELFGFNKIQDNTLLAQEFKAFGQKFKDIQSVEQKLEQQVVDEQTEEVSDEVVEETPIEIETVNNIEEQTIGNLSQTADDTMTLDINDDDMFSAIDITSDNIVVPNMNSIRAGLNAAERAQFDTSLTTGETQIYCI